MKYVVILEGSGGELDRREVETEAEIGRAVIDIARNDILAPGDVIRVIERENNR